MLGRVPDAFHCEACDLDFSAEVGRCPRCLKQSSVQPAGAGPGQPAKKRVRSPGERHVEVNAILQLVMVAAHVLFTLSAAINLALTLAGAGEAGHPLAGLYPIHATDLERTTALVTYGWIGLWSVIGVFWTPFNAWGLFKRRPWARATTIAYYVASMLGCCCLPLGAYGIWSMGRKDVADLLRGREVDS